MSREATFPSPALLQDLALPGPNPVSPNYFLFFSQPPESSSFTAAMAPILGALHSVMGAGTILPPLLASVGLTTALWYFSSELSFFARHPESVKPEWVAAQKKTHLAMVSDLHQQAPCSYTHTVTVMPAEFCGLVIAKGCAPEGCHLAATLRGKVLALGYRALGFIKGCRALYTS